MNLARAQTKLGNTVRQRISRIDWHRIVEGGQSTLFPECLDDWIDEDNPVRVIDVFIDELDLGELGFGGVDPKATGRPSYLHRLF
jgi:hypothetical protein